MASPQDRASTGDLGDGRVARSLRTRRAIVDALLDLLGRGELRPTAERIAAAAGVSVRSIFQHFADVESLFVEASARYAERIAARSRGVAAEAGFDERLSAFVTQRARLYEDVAGVARAAHLQEPFSSVIQASLREARGRSRREIERLFRGELEGFGVDDRRELLEALAAVASWYHWETLRNHQRLSRARAQRVVERSLRALLSREPSRAPR